MRAIVMTFDQNRPYTEHMIFKYSKLWPDHPFVFRIPYQKLVDDPTARTEYVRTPSAISLTVLELIQDLQDNEWVYWAIDDKYPIHLNLPVIKRITDWIPTIKDPSISGILFCRVREMLKSDFLSGKEIKNHAGDIFLERTNYQQIWIHQFVRVKVLRHLFESMPQEPINKLGAAIMDKLKHEVTLPDDHRLFVSAENFAAYGESTSKGKITENCYESIKKSGIALPARFEIIPKSITMGETSFKKRSLFF